MSESTQGMALVWRVATEYRRLWLSLSLTLLANVGVYALVVHPLSEQVANIALRDRAAEQALAAARQEHAEASGALTGKAAASAELATFYNDVLPQGLADARRLTYLRLAQLARDAGLDHQGWRATPTEERDSTLKQLAMRMVLSGAWPDVRAFIYDLETAPEFVVIDNVELAEGAEGGSLALTLELSTYYQDAAQ